VALIGDGGQLVVDEVKELATAYYECWHLGTTFCVRVEGEDGLAVEPIRLPAAP
jgi:hypothetical protein